MSRRRGKTTVPMSRPSATRPGGCGEGPLAVQQGRPHGRHGRHPRGAMFPAASVRRSRRDVAAVQQDALAAGRSSASNRTSRRRGERRRGRPRRRPARPRAAPASATSRYRAPLSSRCQPSGAASRRLTVPLPEPLGPSMAMTGTRHGGAPSGAAPRRPQAGRPRASCREPRERRGDVGHVEDLDRSRPRAGSPRRRTSRPGGRHGCRSRRRRNRSALDAQCRPAAPRCARRAPSARGP